jgi:hypothetical protein
VGASSIVSVYGSVQEKARQDGVGHPVESRSVFNRKERRGRKEKRKNTSKTGTTG